MKFRMLYVVLMSVAIAGCSSDEPEIRLDDMVVNMTAAGQLGEALGTQANEITKLTVRGPINSDDFNAMWSASFNGQLSVIDLSSAAIEGNAIPAYAFYHPDIQNPINGLGFTLKLEQIILPEGISKIGASAFEFAQLTEVSIPSTVETIEKYAFSGCFNLISVSLPSSIKNIREYCFSGCPELRRVYIPSSLESLDKECFNTSSRLAEIYSASKIPPVCRGAADGDTPFGRYDYAGYSSSISDAIPVYVPVGAAELYRNAPGWDYFNNFIELDPFPTEAAAKMR